MQRTANPCTPVRFRPPPPQDEFIFQIQRVDHDGRLHLDIETDDISAEVTRLENPGTVAISRLERRGVMQAPTGQRFFVVQVQRTRLPKGTIR
jgi:hypothetical protein